MCEATIKPAPASSVWDCSVHPRACPSVRRLQRSDFGFRQNEVDSIHAVSSFDGRTVPRLACVTEASTNHRARPAHLGADRNHSWFRSAGVPPAAHPVACHNNPAAAQAPRPSPGAAHAGPTPYQTAPLPRVGRGSRLGFTHVAPPRFVEASGIGETGLADTDQAARASYVIRSKIGNASRPATPRPPAISTPASGVSGKECWIM